MAKHIPKKIPISQWMKHSTVRFKQRNPDAVGTRGSLALCQRLVIDVIATAYEPFCRDSFFISIRARQILTDNITGKMLSDDELFKAETTIHKQIEELHEYFNIRITQGEQLLQSNGFALADIQRLENHYETETFTPATTHYLEIVAKADLYLSILHHLWATGELADSPDEAQRVKLRAENEVRANLYSLSRLSNSHLHNVQRICNAVIQQKAIQRKKQAEQDRMIAAKIAKRNAQREANQLAANAANQLKLEEERREKSRERRANAAKKAKSSAQSDMDALVAAAA